MSWIRMLPRENAEGELGRSYDRVWSGPGPVDNILAIHSLHPRTMVEHFELYKTLMARPGPLPKRERELVALAVSAVNECHY